MTGRTGWNGDSRRWITSDTSHVESLPGTRWPHADAEPKEDNPRRVVVSFDSEHAPVERRQIALAITDAQKLVLKPEIIVFAAFQFDPEAAKDSWARLAKNLTAEVDSELIVAYRGTISLPFEVGDNRRITVKIVDDRRIESLKIVEVGE